MSIARKTAASKQASKQASKTAGTVDNFAAQAKEDATFKVAEQDPAIVAAAMICNGMPAAEMRSRILRVAAGLPPVAAD